MRPTGAIEFSAGGSGAFESPRYDVKFRIADLTVSSEPVGQVNGTLALRGNELSGEVEVTSSRLAITGTGKIALNAQADAELTFRFHESSLDPYVRLFMPSLSPYTTAVASGSMHVVGELADLNHLLVDGTVDSVDMRLFDYELRNGGPIKLALDKNVIRVQDLQLVGEGTQLRIGGTIGLQDQRIALQALGDANLSILQGFFPNEMRGSGRAELTAAVNGPLYTPEFSGTATITNGRIRHFSLPNSLDAINGVVRFDSRGVRLDDVTAMMGGGRIQFGGRVGFEGYMPGELNVTARGEGLQLRVPEGVRSVVDADLAVRGNFKAPTIGGTVTVRSAIWNRRIDPTAELFDFGAAVAAATGEPAAAVVPLRFDLQLIVPATLRIENNLARLVVSADMQLRGTAERPMLFGRAEVDRGEILFEGRRYLVTRGALEFNNPARIEPFFDVEAETRVRVPGETYRVIINLTGTTQSLVPQFTSDPPLASDADVVALLFSDVRRDRRRGAPRIAELQRAADRHPDDPRHPAARQPGVVGSRPRRRADVRRRHLPGDAVAVRSVSQPDDCHPADQSFRACHDREAGVRSRLPDVFTQPQHLDQRSDPAARVRRKRPALVDPLAKRERNVFAGGPREAHLLMFPRLKARPVPAAGALVLLLLVPAAAAAEIGDYLGKPIASIRLQIEGRPAADEHLRRLIQLREGSPLTMLAVRETVAHLFSFGEFEDVQVQATSAAGGVDLLFELAPLHPVTRVVFTGVAGVPGGDEGRLRSAVLDRFGASPSPGRAQDIARLVETELARRGYLHARVSSRLELEHMPDRSTLVLDVQPGARTVVGAVEVIGAPGLPEHELLQRLGITPGTPYQPEVLAARIENYLTDRRERGFYEARLAALPRFADADRIVNLSLDAVEGPRVRIVFTGEQLPDNVRDQLVPIAREGSTDEDLLEDSTNRIRDYLHSQGYRDAKVSHQRMQDDGELVVGFAIERGPRYRLAAVTLEGNEFFPASAARTAAARRAWPAVRRRPSGGRCVRHPGAVPPPRVCLGGGRCRCRTHCSQRRRRRRGAGDPHRDRRARPDDGRVDSHRREHGGFGSGAAAGTGPEARRRVLRHADGDRPRCDSGEVRQPRLSPCDRRSRPGTRRGRPPRRSRLPRARRPADLRRARPARRKPADASGNDRTRAAGQGGGRAGAGCRHRDAAPPDRAGAVPPHANHAAVARRRKPARPADHGRGGTADDDRLWRRLRGRAADPGNQRRGG